ncbi:hypothetical protein [Streptomyces genisteinicus]|uniref:Uncharacterized protein n=1 Tax=Streptomyces genisteinicus TaxID=2768068 RepID=A0A7H0HSW0_9ACTN|nr:hypothetical protein [Streptomyces genisteinicus]QNP63626.1 hypothetical protein IAG43_12235 [Streptomyces genisteinicus]
MRYKNEEQIKKALGIDSWRHLSKDKMVRFVAMMPDMSTEVALRIVEQFPAFKDFAKNAVDMMQKQHESTLAANDRSQEHVHQAFREIREILARELDKGDLTWEQRTYLIEQIQKTGRDQSEKDTESKKFLDTTLGKSLAGVGALAALAVAFVGGRVLAEGNGDSEDSSEG